MLHFTITRFIVALLVSLSTFVRIYTGIDLGIDETIATMLVGGVVAILAFLIPSFGKRKASPPSSTPKSDRLPPSDPE